MLPSRHWRRLTSSSCLSMPLARSGWHRTLPQESSLSFFKDVSRVKACMGYRHIYACNCQRQCKCSACLVIEE